jgi:ribosome-binding factor A
MSKRIQRVNQLIKREISQIILREIDSPKDTLITVTRVETTPNLIESRVFISVLPEENCEKIIKFLKKIIYQLQQKINKKLKMRPVPKIIFMEEKKTAEAARIEKILDELKKEKK